ncbi:MAG TPA: ABC transporter permease [Rhabdaerophilum sp.]|nr:ABC transporter permease [Rhabdaerophilum sp.]
MSGTWNAGHAPDLEHLLAVIARETTGHPVGIPVIVECSGILLLDTLGSHLLQKVRAALSADGRAVVLQGLSPERQALVEEVALPPRSKDGKGQDAGAYGMLADIGEAVVDAGKDLSSGVAFFGATVVALGKLLTGRARLRLPAVVTQLERVGLRGVPIIALISFLVGAIIAQQSIFQLRTFGTVHFVADLLGILVLRELAVLLTAIMIAGRLGSSFTAELGSMKMREEVDALETMGLDPLEVLVLPRILALIIALPLLTFLASMAGIAGGALVAFFYGGVSYEVFFSRLQNAIGFNTFMVGMIKAPFMALVIGIIACIEGFAVRGSAESLGSHTTASVVKAIFIVIVVDGLFAMFFAAIDY